MITDLVEGVIIGLILSAGMWAILKYMQVKTKREEHCPHGLPWDECPVCCH